MYAILSESGNLVQDPTWVGVDDIMRGMHGWGVKRVRGTLMRWDGTREEWVEANRARFADQPIEVKTR